MLGWRLARGVGGRSTLVSLGIWIIRMIVRAIWGWRIGRATVLLVVGVVGGCLAGVGGLGRMFVRGRVSGCDDVGDG